MLPAHPDAVRSSEEECVLEVAVDRLRVVAPGVEMFEPRIGWRDPADVLRSVEASALVFLVAVEPNGDGSAPESLGELVIVVPAERAGLIRDAMGPHPSERLEQSLTHLGHDDDADRSVLFSEAVEQQRREWSSVRALEGRGKEHEGRSAAATERNDRGSCCLSDRMSAAGKLVPADETDASDAQTLRGARTARTKRDGSGMGP